MTAGPEPAPTGSIMQVLRCSVVGLLFLPFPYPEVHTMLTILSVTGAVLLLLAVPVLLIARHQLAREAELALAPLDPAQLEAALAPREQANANWGWDDDDASFAGAWR